MSKSIGTFDWLLNGKWTTFIIVPLSKALYNFFTHTHTHTHTHTLILSHTHGDWMPRKVPTGSSGAIGLGVSLRDTSTIPGWDRTGNPPTARRQLLPPEPHRPTGVLLYWLVKQLIVLNVYSSFWPWVLPVKTAFVLEKINQKAVFEKQAILKLRKEVKSIRAFAHALGIACTTTWNERKKPLAYWAAGIKQVSQGKQQQLMKETLWELVRKPSGISNSG